MKLDQICLGKKRLTLQKSQESQIWTSSSSWDSITLQETITCPTETGSRKCRLLGNITLPEFSHLKMFHPWTFGDSGELETHMKPIFRGQLSVPRLVFPCPPALVVGAAFSSAARSGLWLEYQLMVGNELKFSHNFPSFPPWIQLFVKSSTWETRQKMKRIPIPETCSKFAPENGSLGTSYFQGQTAC